MSSPQQAIAALTRLLETGDEADRCYAARALGVFGGNTAVDALIARLRDEDIDVCVDAAEALGRIGSGRAIPSLIESLKHETSGEICTAVASALGALGAKEASDALLEVAAERPARLEMDDDWDSWWSVQLEAIRALGRIKEERAIAILVDIMDNHEHQDIESEALKMLAQIGGQATDILTQRLQQGSPRSRRRAARALGAVRSTEASRALSRALQDKAAEVRAAAINALAEQGAAHYLPAIMLLMRDESEVVRAAAIQSACQLATPADNLHEPLLTLLNDPSGAVRNSSLHALSGAIEKERPSAEVIQRVAASLDDPDPTVGSSASALLGRCGDASVIPSLTALLADNSRPPILRRGAAQALGEVGVINDDLLQALVEAIGDREQSVCLAALAALVDLADREEEADSTPLKIVIAALAGEAQADPSKEEREEADAVEVTRAAAEECSASAGQPAASTLDAIAMDNAAATADLDSDEGKAAQMDSDTLRYLGMAERQKREAERMQAARTLSAATDDLRQLAARALADSRSAEAVAALVDIVQNKADQVLICEALSSLGRIAASAPATPGLPGCFDLLVAQLDSGDKSCRLAAARALGQLGSRAAIAPLLAALADEARDLRIEAINAITDLVMQEPEGRVALEGVATAAIARQFLNCLDDAADGVRLAVARGLARLLKRKELQEFTGQAVEKMITAALLDDGRQTRPMGQMIRVVQIELGAEKLLVRLEEAEESADRRLIIEMLEELFKGPSPA